MRKHRLLIQEQRVSCKLRHDRRFDLMTPRLFATSSSFATAASRGDAGSRKSCRSRVVVIVGWVGKLKGAKSNARPSIQVVARGGKRVGGVVVGAPRGCTGQPALLLLLSCALVRGRCGGSRCTGAGVVVAGCRSASSRSHRSVVLMLIPNMEECSLSLRCGTLKGGWCL